MNKMKKLVLGIAAAGVLLAGLGVGTAIARTLGRMYANSLHVENEPRSHTAGNFTLGNDDSYLRGKLEVDGAAYFDSTVNIAGSALFTVVPATQTIAGGGTIAADACGSIKRILAASDVTTDTTNTIAAPSSSNSGCHMLIVNVSATQTIYLDSNVLFPITSAASLAIGPKGSVDVWSDGSYWRHGAWTEY